MEYVMMLIERIDEDSKAALKSGNREIRRVLSFLGAEAKKIGKDDGNRAPTDEEVVRTIRKQIINLQENIRLAPESPNAAGWIIEVTVLESYLPQQYSEEQLTTIISLLLPETGRNLKMMGSVMGQLKKEHGGQYDPAMASRITKGLLQE